VTRHLAEGAAVELLGFHWDVLHVPGHSPDSICLSQPALGLLFGGDVLMRGGVGRTDLPGGSFATLAEGIRGKILTLPDSTRVLPGHGPETTVGMEREGNPWLAE
jgi:hydroxyacylglutathione hydrolase